MHETLVALNETRGTCLAIEVTVAKSLLKRLKGLIGTTSERFPPGSGFWIVPCNGIHTVGMRIPIDAVYLDSDYRVRRLCNRLAPFRVAPISFRTKSVLELPAGTLARSGTQVGDILEFKRIAEPD